MMNPRGTETEKEERGGLGYWKLHEVGEESSDWTKSSQTL